MEMPHCNILMAYMYLKIISPVSYNGWTLSRGGVKLDIPLFQASKAACFSSAEAVGMTTVFCGMIQF